MVHERLHANGVPIQLPIGAEETFKGIIDLMTMKAEVYYDDLGKDVRIEEIPDDMIEQAEEYQHKHDRGYCRNRRRAYVTSTSSDEEISVEQILKRLFRKATIANEIVPVLCGTSYRNKGVQMLLDAVIDYMPAPADIADIKGINPETDEEEARPSS